MHLVQQKLLKLVDTYNVGDMSFRQLAQIIGLDHPQLIKHHLEQLEKKGLIEWDKDKKVVTRKASELKSSLSFTIVPVLGSANCGRADVYADQRIEGHIKVPLTFIGRRDKVYAVKAVGYSMNRANINGKNIEDGDYVIIDPNDRNINSNDYVLSIIDDAANIKKIVIDRINSQVCLFSESSYQYPIIYIEESDLSKYLISGKVVQVIKQIKAP